MSEVLKQNEIKSIEMAASPSFLTQPMTSTDAQVGAVKIAASVKLAAPTHPQPEVFRKGVQSVGDSPFLLQKELTLGNCS